MTDATHRRGVLIVAALAILAAAVRLLAVAGLQPIGTDELEFFRASDWIRQGLVPYRDFWEHHTPLVWLLFAPVTALTDSTGVDAIILMRLFQIPVWAGAFWATMQWMSGAGISRFARWTAVATALCSSFLMISAVEFRIDVLGCLLYMLGMLCLMRMHDHRGWAIAAGVAFCLCGFANLRFGPLLALTVLLIRIVDTRNRRWGGNIRANWTIAGAAATFALALLGFAATGSLRQMYQQVWVENYIGDQLGPIIPAAFIHRMILPLGFRLYGSDKLFDPIGIDAAAIAMLGLGIFGVIRALRRWREPDDFFVLAFLQAGSMLFIAAMNFIYAYHFEIVVMMMIPFLAAEIDRLVAGIDRRRRIAIAFVALFSVLNFLLVFFRGKEHDLAYQDLVMTEVHRRTPPGSQVWSATAFAIRRQPAYRFWFLPDLALRLVESGAAAPYRPQDFLNNPPAAAIVDHGGVFWLSFDRPLRNYLVRHYLPLWSNLWLPAMSVRLEPQQRIVFLVPADGRYRVYASNELSKHRWFRAPVQTSATDFPNPERLPVDLRRHVMRPDAGLEFYVDGKPVVPVNGVLELRKRAMLGVAAANSREPLGIMLVPSDDPVWFQQPGPSVSINGVKPRVTHVPDLGIVGRVMKRLIAG